MSGPKENRKVQRALLDFAEGLSSDLHSMEAGKDFGPSAHVAGRLKGGDWEIEVTARYVAPPENDSLRKPMELFGLTMGQWLFLLQWSGGTLPTTTEELLELHAEWRSENRDDRPPPSIYPMQADALVRCVADLVVELRGAWR